MFAFLSRDFSTTEIVQHLSDLLISHSGQQIFNSISIDSRNVQSGSLFIALPGTKTDGKNYLQHALDQGASAVLVEGELNNLPGIAVKDLGAALPSLLNYLFDSPSLDLNLIGVTGTNGKTTVNWMIYEALKYLDCKPLRIGTLGIEGAGVEKEIDLTTADIVTNYSVLSTAISRKTDYCVMEVSSHALTQYRITGFQFDCAIYTNISRDHFDYHDSFEDYFKAKSLLFTNLENSQKHPKLAVINIDCPYGKQLAESLVDSPVKVITYGKKNSADVIISDSSQDRKNASYKFIYKEQEIKFESEIIGYYNEYNFAAAVAVLIENSFLPEKVSNALSAVPVVPGRLEPFSNNLFSVYVDYAHTPDALQNALQTLRPLAKSNLWVVFGCGGDRDRGKRSEMAKACVSSADKLVVTSDNPRTEDPDQIIADIIEHCNPEIVEVDRTLAIQKTLADADKGDIILIAGKGHEDYQEIGTKKVNYSDRQVVKTFLSRDS